MQYRLLPAEGRLEGITVYSSGLQVRKEASINKCVPVMFLEGGQGVAERPQMKGQRASCSYRRVI